MSKLENIKIGLAVIVVGIIGLIIAFMTVVIVIISGIGQIFGMNKLVDLCDKIINKVSETTRKVNNKFDEIVDKIIE